MKRGPSSEGNVNIEESVDALFERIDEEDSNSKD
jgi:hypothetical protein